MIPALTALAATAANPKTRLGFIYVPHGAVMDKWTPAAEGAGFEFTPILSPLEPFRDRLTIVSGLANKAAESQGDGGGDHARSAPSYLSGVHPKRTEGEDIHAGMTIDQIAAEKIGQDTPLPSLELGTEDTGLVGVCDVGYSCAYMNSIAWKSPDTPLPMEINPRVVFERLFGDGSSDAERLAHKQEDRSILDSVTQETSHLQKGLGARDRRGSPSISTTSARSSGGFRRRRSRRPSKSGGAGDADRRAGIVRRARQADVRSAGAGVSGGYHAHLDVHAGARSEPADVPADRRARAASRHFASREQSGDDREAREDQQLSRHAAGLLHPKLKATPDGDGTLLDHSMILYGSSMSNPNEHNHFPLPLLLIGGASGKLKGGRHLKFPERTPMSNMLLSVLEKSGIHMDKLGDSTGAIEI